MLFQEARLPAQSLGKRFPAIRRFVAVFVPLQAVVVIRNREEAFCLFRRQVPLQVEVAAQGGLQGEQQAELLFVRRRAEQEGPLAATAVLRARLFALASPTLAGYVIFAQVIEAKLKGLTLM